MARFDWDNPVLVHSLYLAALVRAFRRFRDPSRRASGRNLGAFYERAWREAAARLGASFEPLGEGFAEVRLGDAVAFVHENSCPIDDPVTQAVAGHKPLTYRLLERHGLPTPRHTAFRFGALAPALEFLRATGGDCVVKPAAGTGGGRGVATGIRTPWQLARAAAAAAVYGDDLLIEEQREGENFRLLYLDGELIDAFARRPPSLVGDGRTTVAGLVRQANGMRLRSGSGVSQVLLTVDLDARRTLSKQGLSLRSVPAAGKVVTLKTVVNENCGDDNVTATDWLCPEVIEAGALAARALGVRLAGVDLIATDPGVPLAQGGGVILEVNTPPNYYYHYHKRDGAFRVAEVVLGRLLRSGAPTPVVAGELLL